jgi:hypothetical protein
MMNLYYDFLTLIISIFIFHLAGMIFGFLLCPKLFHKLMKEKRKIELYLFCVSISFAYNAFMGYILDLFWNITWYSHLTTVLIGLLGLIFRDGKKIKNYLTTLINTDKILSKFVSIKKDQMKFLFSIGIIILLFFITVFNIPTYYFSVPFTDPTLTMEKIQYCINYQHITWHPSAVGLINWTDRHYPIGFYANMTFFCVYSPKSVYFIVKFFGPMLSILITLQIGVITYNISKNKIATIISMLCWISSFYVIVYSLITVSSNLGLFMALSAISLMVMDIPNKEIYSGFILGAGIIIHSFTGGIFLFLGFLFYFLLRCRKKSYRILFLKFIFSFGCIILPYLLLFNYPPYGNIPSFFSHVFNLSLYRFSSLISTTLLNLRLQISWNWNINYNLFLFYGPFPIYYIFMIFAIKKKNHEICIILLGLLLASVAYMVNPIVINGTPLQYTFDQLYPSSRVLIIVSIPVSIFSGIGFDILNKKIKKFFEKMTKKHNIHFRKKNYSLIFIFFLIILQLNTININIEKRNQNFWPNNVPDDYTETLLWLGNNLNNNDTVIVPEIEAISNQKKLDGLHHGLAFGINFIINDTYYNISNLQNINSSIFKNIDYIVIPTSILDVFSIYIENLLITNTFISKNKDYQVYKF